jgi:tripartite-type tricarboxylate transporter receptor subunit TctC
MAAVAAGLLPRTARAQGTAPQWPTRFVRLIVPFPPGGGTDAVARILTHRLSEMWGQQVVIENRGGAGSNIGNEAAARAEPDGYTILFATVALAINRYMYASLPYDPIADFAPITVLCDYPNVMVVPNTSPARSVTEFIALAKAKPGMTFGSSGVGTTPHLSGELFKRMAGLEMMHVPYRGAGPALNDLIPGRIDMMFNTIGATLTQVRGGHIRALAVTSPERFLTAPELPTVAESGVPGFDVTGWYALAGAGAHAGRDRAPDQRRHAFGVARAGGEEAARGSRRAGHRLEPGRDGGSDRRRDAQVGADHPGGRDRADLRPVHANRPSARGYTMRPKCAGRRSRIALRAIRATLSH